MNEPLNEIELDVRVKLMVKAAEMGLDQPSIARVFKISRQRVYQIINNYRASQLSK